MVEEQYFFGMPKSAFFKVDKKIAIVIACSEYDQVEKFADLPEAMDDANEVVEGLHRLKFNEEEITVIKNVGYQEVKIAID